MLEYLTRLFFDKFPVFCPLSASKSIHHWNDNNYLLISSSSISSSSSSIIDEIAQQAFKVQQVSTQITQADQSYVSPASWTVWGIFTVYTIVTLVTFFFRRNKQPVKARSSFFVFILILAHYFSFSILSLRLAVGREAFPCAFYLSFQFYGFPLIAIPYLVLCIRLYYISEMNRLQGDSFKSHLVTMGVDLMEATETKKVDKSSSQANLLSANSSLSMINGDNSPSSSPTSFDQALDRKSSSKSNLRHSSSAARSFKEKVKDVLHLGNNEANIAKSKKWSEKRQKRLKHLRKLARDDFIAKIFLFTFLLNSIIFLGYCGVFLNRLTGEETWNVGCAATIEVYAGSVALILFYGLFILVFFYKVMRYAKESFGIKLELISVVIIWAIFLLGFVLMSVIPAYQDSPEYYFAAAWMVNIPLFMTSIISVWIPLIRSFIWKNSDGTRLVKKAQNNTSNSTGGSKSGTSVFADLSSGDLDNERIKNVLYTEAGFLKKENIDEQDERIVDTRVILYVMFHEEVCQKYFKEWCELEFSAENFLFLYFVNKIFNHLPTNTEDEIKKKTLILEKLSESFVVNGAPFELNLSSNVKKEFDRSLKQLTKSTTLNNNADREMVAQGDVEWTQEKTELLNTVLDSVEITCLNCVQDTWSRFILSSNFVDMVKEMKKYDEDMKNLNLV